MEKGVYCLVLVHGPCTIRVGALGNLAFPGRLARLYRFCPRARGLKRVQRHIRSRSRQKVETQWHIDYLLGIQHVTLRHALCAQTTRPVECRLARALGGIPVNGFGCSDCRCGSHLFYFDKDPVNKIVQAMRSIGLDPVIATINTKQG